MTTAKWISLSLLFICARGWAVEDGTYRFQRSAYAQRLESSKSVLRGLSLVMPSFVVHGVAPSQTAAQYMPRKVDGNGSAVITPGVGLQYVTDDGLLLVGALVKDCYDGLAGALQVGEIFQISDRTNWGLTFGIYARQTPQTCETSSDGRTTTMDCFELDNYRLKFMSKVNGYSVDIIPMPFLHFTTALYKSRDLRLDFKVMSNFVLNEFGFSVPF